LIGAEEATNLSDIPNVLFVALCGARLSRYVALQ